MNLLQKGDAIGVFSPSTPITAKSPIRFNRAINFLESMGFKIVLGSLTGKSDFYRSGSIIDRANELNELIRNPNVKCIMSTIGGMNSNSLWPYIDYESLKKSPKIIIGYSDMTAILLAIYNKCGITTYYGPALVASFGELAPLVNETYSYFEDILVKGIKTPYLIPTPKNWTDEFIPWEAQDKCKETSKNSLITVIKGKATGRVIGGNLNTIQGIWGSKYMPEIKDGDIVFIEDSLHNIATIERSFSLLKINGVFDRVSGIILGKHELFNDLETGRKPYQVLLEVLNGQNIPFLADFDCCHTHPMLTIPIGSTIELDATNKTVTII